LTPAAYRPGFFLAIDNNHGKEKVMPTTFTLSRTEAAYVVGALRVMYETITLNERDQIIITGLIDKLAAPMNLSPEVIARLTGPGRRT